MGVARWCRGRLGRLDSENGIYFDSPKFGHTCLRLSRRWASQRSRVVHVTAAVSRTKKGKTVDAHCSTCASKVHIHPIDRCCFDMRRTRGNSVCHPKLISSPRLRRPPLSMWLSLLSCPLLASCRLLLVHGVQKTRIPEAEASNRDARQGK